VELNVAKNILKLVGPVALGWNISSLTLAQKICGTKGAIVKSEWSTWWRMVFCKAPNIHQFNPSGYDIMFGLVYITDDDKRRLTIRVAVIDLSSKTTTLKCKFTVVFDKMFDELVPHLWRAYCDTSNHRVGAIINTPLI
jgi:cytidine deaminase